MTAITWEHQQGSCYYAHLGTFYANSAIHLIFLQYIPPSHTDVKQKGLNLLSSYLNYENQCMKESLSLSDTARL